MFVIWQYWKSMSTQHSKKNADIHDRTGVGYKQIHLMKSFHI